MGVGSGDRGEERRGMKGAGVEEVGRFCRVKNISNRGYGCDGNRDCGVLEYVRRPDLRV